MKRAAIVAFVVTCAIAVAFPPTGRAQNVVQQDAVVQFGQGQPQGPIAAGTHLLDPDDVTIVKGGTVTLVVNGGGHGVAIYPVAKQTTRGDIWPDLCNGPSDTTEADRVSRSLVDCNGTVIKNGITGTQNLAYTLTDGKNNIVVLVPTNTATTVNPRVDDMTTGSLPRREESPATRRRIRQAHS